MLQESVVVCPAHSAPITESDRPMASCTKYDSDSINRLKQKYCRSGSILVLATGSS